MRVERHYSMIHSDRVLKLVRRLAKGKKGELSVACWSNGREQGYHIDNFDLSRAVCFAQQRNSDGMIVIAGESSKFDVTTNMPDDDLWENSNRYFRYSQDEEAAQYIVDYLTGA